MEGFEVSVDAAESGIGTYFGNSPYIAITSDDDGQTITVLFRAY